jgi:cobalt-precorrin 5A hydrolase
MIIAGIGCRKGVSAAAIAGAILAALARAGLGRRALGMIAVPEAKANEPGIAAAASELGVPLVLVSSARLAANAARTRTRSKRVAALVGVPCVCEAAALAAGGQEARLLLPRLVVGQATCALAATGGGP